MYTLLAIRDGTRVLDYDKAYTSLSLLALLQTPMALIIDAIAGVVSAVGALQRIGEYLSKPASCAPEQEDSHRTKLVSSPSLSYPSFGEKAKQRDTIVYMRDFSARWDEKKPFVLKNLSVEILSSTINFIVGPVACGKTTLLHAILGETPCTEGIVHVSPSRISFCSQTPWISNDSIQRNILGTNIFVQGWYEKVVDACALREDIRSFPQGDQEVIGNSGMMLSGGQKARLVSVGIS
jgi:ABC-type multidrug transport system fused ATPase/permease subunit